MAKSARPEPADDDAVPAGTKGRATPTRKEQEAARKRPLVPTDRRLAAKQSRAQTNEARERQRKKRGLKRRYYGTLSYKLQAVSRKAPAPVATAAA